MDSEFNNNKAEAAKIIQKCIDMKWITVPDFISIDGIAAQFANQKETTERHNKVRDVMNFMIWLHDFYPEELQQIYGLADYIRKRDEEVLKKLKEKK